MVSRHATGKDLTAAIKLARFVTTNPSVLTTNVTFPAYGPEQIPWLNEAWRVRLLCGLLSDGERAEDSCG